MIATRYGLGDITKQTGVERIKRRFVSKNKHMLYFFHIKECDTCYCLSALRSFEIDFRAKTSLGPLLFEFLLNGDVIYCFRMDLVWELILNENATVFIDFLITIVSGVFFSIEINYTLRYVKTKIYVFAFLIWHKLSDFISVLIKNISFVVFNFKFFNYWIQYVSVIILCKKYFFIINFSVFQQPWNDIVQHFHWAAAVSGLKENERQQPEWQFGVN